MCHFSTPLLRRLGASGAICLGGASLLCLASQASAASLTYTAQTRTISASASDVGASDGQTDSAPDFNLFDAAVSASAGASGASASQRSELLPLGVTMTGRVSGFDGQPGNAGSGSGLGSSTLMATFSLDEPAPYTFNLDITQPGNTFGPAGGYSTSLTGPGGTVFSASLPGGGGGTFDSAGLLQSGSYVLSVRFSNGGQGTGTSGGRNDYSAVLAIPEPATATLAGLGLVLAAARRRRRRQ